MGSRFKTQKASITKTDNLTCSKGLATVNCAQQCDYCLFPLPAQFIECAECENAFFCFDCFSSGIECEDHVPAHAYYICVTSVGNLVVFRKEKRPWVLKEENLLLIGVEQFGYGNWENISDFIRTKSPLECQTHFDRFYIDGMLTKVIRNRIPNPLLEVRDYTSGCEESIILPPVIMSDWTRRLIGFLPLRDDYEREYKNDVERLMNKVTIDLQIPTGQNDIESSGLHQSFMNSDEKRFEIFRVYLSILCERQELKRHMRDYGLISFELSELLDSSESSKHSISHIPKSIAKPIHSDGNRAVPHKLCRLSKDNRAIISQLTSNELVLPVSISQKAIESQSPSHSVQDTPSDSTKARIKGRNRLKAIETPNARPFSADSLSVVRNALRLLRTSKRHASSTLKLSKYHNRPKMFAGQRHTRLSHASSLAKLSSSIISTVKSTAGSGTDINDHRVLPVQTRKRSAARSIKRINSNVKRGIPDSTVVQTHSAELIRASGRSVRTSDGSLTLPANISFEGMTDDEKKELFDQYKSK